MSTSVRIIEAMRRITIDILLVKTLMALLWILVAFLRVIGRLKVSGIENIQRTCWQNRLILPNHPSFIEPVIIPIVAFMPRMFFSPKKYFPWYVGNEYYIVNASISFLLRGLPTIPLKTDEDGRVHDPNASLKILRRIKNATVIAFPEATRSYHADPPFTKTSSGIRIGKGRGGIGTIIFFANPTVIPVLVKGMEEILPPRDSSEISTISMIFKIVRGVFSNKMEIIFGAPLDLSYLYPSKGASKEEKRTAYEAIADAVVAGIAALDKNPSKSN